MSYHIQINDEQRLALLELLSKVDTNSENNPLEYWVEMLTELPAIEAENPGITHGFCL